MDNLYILTKQEFTSLYRFGKIPLIIDQIIRTVNSSDEEINLKIYEGFLSLPYFVGDEEYLIISFENVLIDNIWLEIEYVNEIIPLTKAAKNSFQMKFDTKLDFKDARFEKIVQKVEEQIDIQERYRGAKAFWKLCQVKSEFRASLANEIIESAYHKRINAVKSSEFKDDFYIHLLAYDRYEFFPNTDLGYFYDVGEIYAHSKGKSSFKGSGFHSFLENNKQILTEKSFLQIAQSITEAEEIKNFTSQLSPNGMKEYLAAAIFLKFKDDLSERDTIKDSVTGKLIGEIRKNHEFINELNLAIFITGSYYGYKKFYDDLYELADLNIFKKKVEEPELETNKQKTKIDSNIDKPNIPELGKEQEDVAPLLKEDEADFNDPAENDEINQKLDQKANISTSINETTEKQALGIMEHILEEIFQMLDNENGAFDIKNEGLKSLQQILIPMTDKKNKPLKPEVLQILKDEFHNDLQIDTNGKQNILKRKTDADLFSST